MNRYLDGSYFEPGFHTIGFWGLIIALGALALLFLLEDGRALVRMYIYVFGAIFIVGPLVFNPSVLSPWWFLVVAVALVSDFWEGKSIRKPKGLPQKKLQNVDRSTLKASTNSEIYCAPTNTRNQLGVSEGHNPQTVSYYSASTIVACYNCKQAHTVSPRERGLCCSKCGSKLFSKSDIYRSTQQP